VGYKFALTESVCIMQSDLSMYNGQITV